MGRRLVQTRAAEHDVAEQVDYIAAERPSAARRYLVAYGAACERLLSMPELGVTRSFPVMGYEDVRLWPLPGLRRFLIVYRVTKTTVEVIRVLHSARDVMRVLRGS